MTKLNAVVAIVKGVKSRAYATLTELNKVVQKPELFNGFHKHYQPKNEEGDVLPQERKQVQFTAAEVLGGARHSMTELIDLTAQLDLGNTVAKSAVEVGGREILPELPATTLMFLEKQLTDLRTFVENIPVLDSAEAWSFDTNSGLSVTQNVQTQRTKKTQKPIVLYQATDKHPAQTQLITEDVIDGFWNTVRQSGAMPKPDRDKIAARVEALLIAVKTARERANDVDASIGPKIGSRIFDYLLIE